MADANGAEEVLVIGAGMAGLTLARTLADAGASVTVAEKSRGIGGRMATRRTDHGSFDHGAQYVTGKSAPFRALLTGLSHDGTVAFWKPTGRDRTLEWHVGVPGMSAMLTPMLGGFDLRLRCKADRVERSGERLRVLMADDDGETERTFDRVLCTAPAPQAHALLGDLGSPFERLREASYAPCWTLMLAFEERIVAPDMHRAEPGDGSIVGWAARNASKPGRKGEHDTWVVNATPAWSLEKLERERKDVVPDLLDAFRDLTNAPDAEPVHAAAHRWRYSLVERPLGEPFLLSDDGRVGAAGDWCLAGRVEAAFESGRALADAIKQHL